MSIDRLGRDYDAIGRTWKHLTNTKKVNIKILDMPILNTTNNTLVDKLLSDIILQLLAYVAQTERDNLLKRQAQGIAAAKARGVHFGRPEVNVPKDFKKIVRDWEDKKIVIPKQ
jgi:DNA invertase Pin-like site-specific DNA recombinase